MTDAEIQEPQGATFEEAVMDMGSLFKKMKTVHGVPHTVTMDIVRLQLMYMQQTAAINRIPDTAPEVIRAAEESMEEPKFEVIQGGQDD
jgi:hypothetical protein